ncbi:MAG: PAS domain-containing protein [Armatimonadetes bacterium]|nr:PAS domain-containing protein [Armatimonadota bacterium]
MDLRCADRLRPVIRIPGKLKQAGQIWTNLPLHSKGLVVVAIPLLALIVTTLSFCLVQRQHQQAETRVRRTIETRSAMRNMLTFLLGAEAGIHGYLVIGQEEWLEPYEEARQALPGVLARMEKMEQAEGGTDRIGGMRRIRSLTEQEMAVLAALRKYTGLPARLPKELCVKSKALLSALRREFHVRQASTDRLLLEYDAQADQARQRTFAVIGWGGLLGLGGGLLVALLFAHGLAYRVRRLGESAHRLAQGQPVLPMDSGADEIGRLSRALEDAGALLAWREQALSEAQAFLEHLIDSSPVVIFKCGIADGLVTYVSPNVERLLGYSPKEILGSADFWQKCVCPEDQERLVSTLQEEMEQTGGDYRFRHKNGEYRWLQMVVRLEHDKAGGPVNLLGYTLDITARKRAEEAVRQAKEEAEKANRAKSEFLSRMSHELRTPLNAVLGFGQLLEMDDLAIEQRESVDHILQAGRHLLQLINEVLDIARIESGRIYLSIEPVLVREVLQETWELIEPLAEQQHVRLSDEVTDTADQYVRADHQRLKQVLLNLLANAVKYNREGGTVTVFCEAATNGWLCLKVSDTGPGIPPGKMHRLFTPFDRLGAEQTGVEGTGLGLALSKRLVTAMGGNLGVETMDGQGSTLWVELPLAEGPMARLERQPEGVPAPIGGCGPCRTVLYVEDNLSNVRLIERVLAQRPTTRLLAAMQGQMALDLAREHHPDLILLDLHLPDIPGNEVLHRLQLDPETCAIPVVVISADATASQIERLCAAGARAYLTKPLDVKQFLGIVDEILR